MAPDQLAWLDRFRSDLNNFRAALEWCLLTGDTTGAARLAGALAWFWTLNGMLTEAIEHLERLVDVDELPPPTRARCLWGYALLAASLGRLETARDAGYRAAEVGRSCDDTGTAYGLNAAAVAEWALGNHERSLDAHREAITLLEKLDDRGDWRCATCCWPARCSTSATPQRMASPEPVSTTPAAPVTVTCWASPSRRSRRSPSPAATRRPQCPAASEALDLQERIGYTEGIVSALHVLGHGPAPVG